MAPRNFWKTHHFEKHLDKKMQSQQISIQEIVIGLGMALMLTQ